MVDITSGNDNIQPADPSNEMRWQIYQTIPKGHYCEMAGIKRAQAIRHADQYGMPLKGRTVSLPAVLSWLHPFLSENWRLFAQRDGEIIIQDLPEADRQRLLTETIRVRKADADQRELNLAKQHADVIPVEEFRVHWEIMTAKLRNAIDVLQRRFGPEAAEIFERALNDADAESRKIGRE